MCADVKVREPIKKVPTGIEGLDKILNGGIPKGNTVLVTGSCGTGKTTLCVEYLMNGVRAGDKGLFIAVTESRAKLIENISTYEFFDMAAIEKGDIQVIEFPELMEKIGLAGVEITNENMGVFIKGFIGLVVKSKVSRLVVDSLTGVCFQIKNRDNIRDFVFRLSKQLGEKKVTSLLISEITPDSNSYSTHGVEDAIADGIIVMGNIAQRGHLMRTLHVVKMRGTVHSRAKYVMDLSSYGIIIVPLLKSQT